ncbi:unnamed protein product [Larinioides sclopetarius]|uniref:Uncharacterized protein n=1 Tax=Larinioides sclopetarius TaxID=280406 RepID=A0AAV2B7G1_9ARAC
MGVTAQNIVAAVQEAGGVLTEEDMKEHLLNPPNPVPDEALSIDFNGVTIWEMRPNTIGIVALLIFNILKGYDIRGINKTVSFLENKKRKDLNTENFSIRVNAIFHRPKEP